jgi:phytoene dehydrogenase-like protein
MQTSHHQPKAVVIGAGLAGLTTAALLGKAGWEVVVLEKKNFIGGRCSQTPKGFDFGASIVLFREKIESLLEEAGAHSVPMTQLKDGGWNVHHGNIRVKYTRECFEALEPGSWKMFDEFLERCETSHSITHHAFETAKPLRDTPCTSLRAVKDTIVPIQLIAKRYFQHPALIHAVTSQAAFGGAPTKSLCSQVFGSLLLEAQREGVFYPKGPLGMGEIAESLRLAICHKWGGRVLLEQNVTEIRPGLGVRVGDGEFFRASVIVSSIPYLPGMGLLRTHPSSARTLDYSFSAVNFYWELAAVPEVLSCANTVVIPEGDSGAACVESGFSQGAPELDVYRPCMYIQCQAFAGQPDNRKVTVLCIFPNLLNWPGGATEYQVRALRLAALDHLCISEADILDEEAPMTPQRWEKEQGLPHGSILGPVYTPKQILDLRPAQRWKRGVYRAGASTHPATGVPSVMASAGLCVQQILEDTRDSPLLFSVRTSSTFGKLSPLMGILHSPGARDRLKMLYAVFRLADDLVDEAPGGKEGLVMARAMLERLRDPSDSTDGGLVMIRECIPFHIWELFLEGLEADVDGSSGERGLDWYCLRVAGVVGEAFGHAVTPGRHMSATEIEHRRELGIAIQRLHIVRDYLQDKKGTYLVSLAQAHREREAASRRMASALDYLRASGDIPVAERLYIEVAARAYERMAYRGYRVLGAARGLLRALVGLLMPNRTE